VLMLFFWIGCVAILWLSLNDIISLDSGLGGLSVILISGLGSVVGAVFLAARGIVKVLGKFGVADRTLSQGTTFWVINLLLFLLPLALVGVLFATSGSGGIAGVIILFVAFLLTLPSGFILLIGLIVVVARVMARGLARIGVSDRELISLPGGVNFWAVALAIPVTVYVIFQLISIFS